MTFKCFSKFSSIVLDDFETQCRSQLFPNAQSNISNKLFEFENLNAFEPRRQMQKTNLCSKSNEIFALPILESSIGCRNS